MATVTFTRRLQRLEQHRAIKDAPPFESWIVDEGVATNQKTGEEIGIDELEERSPPRITWVLIPEIPMHDDSDWFALSYWAGHMRENEYTLDGIARALEYESTDAMEDDILNGRPWTERYERCLENAKRRVAEAGRSWSEVARQVPDYVRDSYRPLRNPRRCDESY
jgi:hypothetical protein